MIVLVAALFLFAPPPQLNLEQIRADSNSEHRARAAIEYSVAAERNAETSYSRGDLPAVKAELKNMLEAVELAKESLDQTGKSPMKHPGPYKFGELRTQEMLVRLGDLERKMDAEERPMVEAPKARVQEIHDAWFDGIMSKRK